jgi:hypothetical protein
VAASSDVAKRAISGGDPLPYRQAAASSRVAAAGRKARGPSAPACALSQVPGAPRRPIRQQVSGGL